MTKEQIIAAAQRKDAVFQASIDFIETLTGMKPPPIEIAPPETFQPFRDFTERVCKLFSDTSLIEARAKSTSADLQGLRDKLLTPMEIVRDEAGWFRHPALPLTDENVSFRKLLEAFQLDIDFVSLEDDGDDKAKHQAVFEQGSCTRWTPTTPAGEGWLLLAIYNTRDWPYALFVRAENVARQTRREKQDLKAAPVVAKEPAQADEYALLTRWEAQARDALPADAMLINKHARELRDVLAAAAPTAQATSQKGGQT